jgi:hypothetical protein
MIRVAAASFVVAIFAAACASFGAASTSPADGDAGADADAGAGTGAGDVGSDDDARAADSFCASKSAFDVCSDFDDPSRAAGAGWDSLNGANGMLPAIDEADAKSPPSSLRFDVAAAGHQNVGLAKTIGAGTVFHIEAAVRFDRKVQADYVDIARIVLTTPNGAVAVQVSMQPTGMHFAACPPDVAECVYGNPPYDLQEWKTLSFDFDVSARRAKFAADGVTFLDGEFGVEGITGVTVIIGPREAMPGNTLIVRYDNVLVSHR